MAWMKDLAGGFVKTNHISEFGKDELLPVGTTMSYPTSDHGFVNVHYIPEEVARLWLDVIGVRLRREMAAADAPYSSNLWMNKVAVVVESDALRGELALYHHDNKFWIIRRNR